MPMLQCTVSLLTDFEQALDIYDWTIGTHGVLIDFIDPCGTSRTAVYLPEVPPEQGWTKAQTIDSLIHKSGYMQPITDNMRSRIRLTRYQSSLMTRSYDDWLKARQPVIGAGR